MIIDTPAKQILFSTVRIEVETGGDPGYGTGFMYRNLGHRQETFIVTCRHVVDGARRAHLFFTRAAPDSGVAVGDRVNLTIENLEQNCHFHPDRDIAIIPMAALRRSPAERELIYTTVLDNNALPTPELLRELDVIEDVFFVGYPAGYYDHSNLTPIFRRGVTASPIHLNYNDRPEFLVDGAVYFGSSGSPVFILRKRSFWNQMKTHYRHQFVFLGVMSEVMRTSFDGQLGFIHPAALAEGVAAARLLNLGVVLKGHLVDQTIQAYLGSKVSSPEK